MQDTYDTEISTMANYIGRRAHKIGFTDGTARTEDCPVISVTFHPFWDAERSKFKGLLRAAEIRLDPNYLEEEQAMHKTPEGNTVDVWVLPASKEKAQLAVGAIRQAINLRQASPTQAPTA